MNDVAGHRERVRAAIGTAGTTVIVSPSVSAPDGAGLLVVPLDADTVATTRALVAALSPRLVLFGGIDEKGFDGHLVADHWVRVMFMTTSAIEAIEDAIESADDDWLQPLDEHDQAVLRQAATALESDIGLSDHGGANELSQLLRERVRRDAPPDAERILGSERLDVWELTSELLLALKDRHAALLRNRAREYAQRILDEEGPFSAPFLRAAQRDVAYRYLKRIDPTCTTRASSDPVALELGALVNG